MSSLFGTISISLRALLVQQAALQTTSDNISNINTPGYSRRRPVMVEEDPSWQGSLLVGNGVRMQAIESLRDRVLELRLHEETQEKGNLQGFLGPMKQVEVAFGSVENGIGSDLDSFFNAITRLSTDATSIPLRQNVLTAAGNLASSLSNSAKTLVALQQDIDRGITQRIADINQLSSQIASLNSEVARSQSIGGDASEFEDQRTESIRNLSELIGLTMVEGDDGTTITTATGDPLVVGNKSFSLDFQAGADGKQHVYAGGTDITADISGGELGGLIRARDEDIEQLIGSLNAMASSVATAINDANKQGFDLNGAAGGNIFADPGSTDAAANMKLELTDPAKLAASGDGSQGDNSNLAKIGSVRTSAVVAGKTPLDFYSDVVAGIGNAVARAESDQSAGELILGQLEAQRASISGVSLDEEAANLIKYQRAFEAAARVISVVNDLTETVISLGRN
jgi:flagellar hook-associated protein 1 FlgK